MAPLRRLLPYLRPHRARFLLVFLVMAAVAGLNGATIWALRLALNAVCDRKDPRLLLAVVALIPAFFFLKMLLSFAQTYLMSHIGLSVLRRLREDLFRHLHGLSLEFFWKSHSAENLSRLSFDVGLLGNALQSAPVYLVRDCLTILVVVGVLFAIRWQFALIALLAAPLAAAVLAASSLELRAAGRRSQELMAQIYRRSQESLQGMPSIMALDHAEAAIARFNEQNAAFFQQMLFFVRASAIAGPLIEFLGSFVAAVIVYKGGQEILGGTLATGDFFIFLGSFLAAYGPIKGISQINATLQMGAAATERIFSILDERPAVVEHPRPIRLERLEHGIELENVSFRYPGREQWALRELSLRIPAGEVLAVVGPSGSGKTTLAHLLLRLFDPQEGRILIDGRDLREFSLSSLRSRLGLVGQETAVFDDSLAANVSLAEPAADAAAVERALEASGAMAFARQLPQGTATLVGDRGLLLSGGQRQLVAIARAALKNPAVLLLDEATSNLDAPSENAAQRSLAGLYPGRTVLIIGHRLSALKDAGRIVVLGRGRVQEAGSHAELLAAGGLYAAMHRLQQLES